MYCTANRLFSNRLSTSVVGFAPEDVWLLFVPVVNAQPGDHVQTVLPFAECMMSAPPLCSTPCNTVLTKSVLCVPLALQPMLGFFLLNFGR